MTPKQVGLVGVDDVVPEAEEVSKRTDDARMAGVVPGELEQTLTVMSGWRHPYVGDRPGAVDISEHAALSRIDRPVVLVATRGVPG